MGDNVLSRKANGFGTVGLLAGFLACSMAAEGWMLESLLPLGVLFILLLALRAVLQLVQQWMLNRTVRDALEKRPESVAEILTKLESSGGSWRQDTASISLLAAGIAMMVAAFLDKGAEQLALIQFALLPLCVGGSLLLHYRLVRHRNGAA